jgi:hypothetical protein
MISMKLILALLLFASVLFAAPSTYNILKLPAGATPVMDGTLTEWDDVYFIDSLESNVNCLASDHPPWTPANIQFMVYGAWDTSKVYFAVRIVHDDVYHICGSDGQCGCDNITITYDGRSEIFKIFSDNTIVFNPSCPFGPTTMQGNCNAFGGNGNTLPSYEFSLDRAILDRLGTGFQLFLGSEDEDDAIGSCLNETYVGLGIEHTGRYDFGQSQLFIPLYYPTYYLDSTVGPFLSVEGKSVARISAERLSASPNPFMPSTVISYKANNAGALKIYDVSGKTVQSFPTKSGPAKVAWNGTDINGKKVSAGIYIARLSSGSDIFEQRLLLMK